MLTVKVIRSLLESQGYTNLIICLHASFKSFGDVKHGPNTIIDGFLAAGNTVMAPAFFYSSEAFAPNDSYLQNGINYSKSFFAPVDYWGGPVQIDASMGAVSKTMLQRSDALRSRHPMCSFVAVGSMAESLIRQQENLNVYSAYKLLHVSQVNSAIFLCGTTLKSCTPVHYAEAISGRNLFRRWALNHKIVEEIEVGGCSDGFEKLRPFVKDIEHTMMMGNSETRVYDFKKFIQNVVSILKATPDITRCNNRCLPCADIIAGGPKLE